MVSGGNKIRLKTISKEETQWIVVPAEATPSVYTLTIKTMDGKEVPTGYEVNALPNSDSPEREDTATTTLNNTPTRTISPPNNPIPTTGPQATPAPTPNPKWKCTTWESEDSDQFSPRAITSDTDGNVYVLDNNLGTQRYRVRIFTSITLLPREWNVADLDQPFTPKGIAVDDSREVYVSDSGNHVVRKLTLDDSNVYMERGTWGDDERQLLKSPHGIAIGASGTVYVADRGTSMVQLFSSEYVGAFDEGLDELFKKEPPNSWNGGSLMEEHTILNPFGITVDGNGNVYVVDAGNHRIQKFSSSGEWRSRWIGSSVNDPLEDPSGIALDNVNDIYVADTGNNRVRILSSEGDESSSYFKVTNPTGIAIDGDNNVYVIASGTRLVVCSLVHTP